MTGTHKKPASDAHRHSKPTCCPKGASYSLMVSLIKPWGVHCLLILGRVPVQPAEPHQAQLYHTTRHSPLSPTRLYSDYNSDLPQPKGRLVGGKAMVSSSVGAS